MKNKKQLTPAQIKELITYADGNSKPPTWKDSGFNNFMEKPAHSNEGQAKRQRDYEDDSRKQQKHEMEMKVLNQQLIPRGRLTFYPRTGKLIYTPEKGSKREANFSIKSNPYLLIKYLVGNPGTVFDVGSLAKRLNAPREGGESSTHDRRVRDTVKPIRAALDLNDENDIFIVDNGYGLNSDVEIKK